MQKDLKVDNILNDLIINGSNISYLKELRQRCISEIKKDKSITESFKDIISDIESYSNEFLEKKNKHDANLISGFSTGIYLSDIKNGGFKYTLVGGNISRNDSSKIDFDTIFDIASITKLYTLILCFILEDRGFINLDSRVCDVNPDFKNLYFTFNDLIRLYGNIKTKGRIDNASSYEDAYEIFKSVYVLNDDKNIMEYNDLGSMVLSDTITKVVSKKMGRSISYDEILSLFIFKPFKMNHSHYNPKTANISGNGYSYNFPHDPKAVIFNGVSGHAGLFTNSDDLFKLSDLIIYDGVLNQHYKNRLFESNIKGSVKGNMGFYLKHKDGYKVTYNPSELSNSSFTTQGYTGSIASFDLYNRIHNNILVNAIIEDKNTLKDKPIGFMEEFDKYQMRLVKDIMLMYVIKKYYNKYCNVKEEINMKRVLIK